MPRRRQPVRGIAVAVILLILLILAVLGAAVARLGIVNLHQVTYAQTRTILVHMANGGLNELMNRMDTDSHTSSLTGVTTGTLTTRLTRAQYWWTFDHGARPYCTDNLASDTPTTGFGGMIVPAHTALLIVSAGKDGAGHPKDSVRVAAIVSDQFPYAVLAQGTITAANLSGWNGLMGNARNNSAGITLESSTGHLLTTGGPGSVQVSGWPKGIVHYNQPVFPVPDFDLASVVAAQKPTANYVFSGNQTASSDGAGDLTIGSTTIAAPPSGTTVSIVVDGSLRFNGGAKLAQGLRLFVAGDFRVNGRLTQDAGNNPDSFIVASGAVTLNGVSATGGLNILAGTSIRQNGGGQPSSFDGLLYVEKGSGTAFVSNGSATWQGSLIVRGADGATASVDAPNSDFIYDPRALRALGELGLSFSEAQRLTVISWWVLRE